MAGLTQNGFEIKRLSELKESLEDKLRNEFGNGIRTSPRSRFGVLIGITAGMLTQPWELAQGVYSAFRKSSAEGVHLENLAEIVGLTRLDATRSQVDLFCTGSAGTTIPSGSTVSHEDTGTLWDTLEDVTLDSNGEGTVPAQSQETGPIEAVSGTLTQIETPVTGWNNVTNNSDAEIGRPEESDDELRRRMVTDLAISGSTTPEAIKAKVKELSGVTSATVIENVLGSPDSANRPGHSFEVVIGGGDDTEIANTIWENKPAGIRTYSTGTGAQNVQVTIQDSEGRDQDINFTRPTDVSIWIECEIIREQNGQFALNADHKSAIQDAILAEGGLYEAGVDVRTWRFERAVSELDFIQTNTEWIKDVNISIGKSDPPGSESIIIDPIERADFDSSRLDIFETKVTV